VTGAQPGVLVATDSAATALRVQALVAGDFAQVAVSVVADRAHAVQDFRQRMPQVLVLAFGQVAAASRYYLDLFTHLEELVAHPHRAILLCVQADVNADTDVNANTGTACGNAAARYFDDCVVLGSPETDAVRLSLSIHAALRELGTLRQGATKAAVRAKPVVLVVDDDDFQHMLVAKILGTEHYQMLFAWGGEEALCLLRRNAVDLVLIDLQMPTLGGLETIRRLKAVAHGVDLPVIAVSGHSDENLMVQCRQAGAVDFVVKPFGRSALQASVARLTSRCAGGAMQS